MLASDAQNPEFSGAHNPDATLSVEFYSRPVQHMFRTEAEGRPIFEDVDYVRIMTPGNDKNIIEVPAREEHKRRFPMQWAFYANNQSEQDVGTPLSQWPQITAAQVAELKALKFKTVEHIANASDQNITNIGMIGGMAPLALRAKAQAFLVTAQNTAAPQQQAAEIERLKQEAADRELQHQAEMSELREMVQKLAENQRKTPGRKPKEEAEA